MKTAEDILKSKLNNTQWNYLHHVLHSGEVYKQILAGMEEYAEQQVKNCNTPDVSTPFCPYCGKFKRMNDNGVMHQLCECTKW